MQKRMDYAIGQMTTFFDILSSRVDAQFAKLSSKRKQREIITVMQKYGFVKYPQNSVIMKRAMTRILRKQEYVDFEDRWDFFRLRLADIFECEYMHCLRWMRSDLVLL